MGAGISLQVPSSVSKHWMPKSITNDGSSTKSSQTYVPAFKTQQLMPPTKDQRIVSSKNVSVSKQQKPLHKLAARRSESRESAGTGTETLLELKPERLKLMKGSTDTVSSKQNKKMNAKVHTASQTVFSSRNPYLQRIATIFKQGSTPTHSENVVKNGSATSHTTLQKANKMPSHQPPPSIHKTLLMPQP